MKISITLLLILSLFNLILKKINIRLPCTHKAIQNPKIINLFFFLSVGLLLFFSVFRGDFAKDYPTMFYQIEIYAKETWREIFTYRDFGFAVLMKIIYLITGNIFWCFATISAVTVILYSYVIYRESCNYFLSLFIFVAFDTYFISFNLMRNIMTCAIFLVIAKNIWEKNALRYVVGILLLSTLHRAALVLLPMYWILSLDLRKRKNILLVVLGVILFMIFLLYTRDVALFVQEMIGMDYLSYDTYGLDFGSLGSALKTSGLMLIILLFINKIDFDNIKQRVWFNACLFAWIMQIMAAKVLMLQRIGFYFSGFFLLLIPYVFSREEKKTLITMMFLVSAFIYVSFFQNVTSFYWIWQNEHIFF